jgi:hypothetical protein
MASSDALQPMHSFVRLKPTHADKEGGVTSKHKITGFDADRGVVELDGKAYDHAEAVLAPDATQLHVYEVTCRPTHNNSSISTILFIRKTTH